MMRPGIFLLSAVALPFAGHAGNLLVCVNDQTVTYATNEMVFLEKGKQAPGSATVIDLAAFPPTSRSISGVPGSVIGPPTSVALVPGKPQAIVTNAMKAEQVDGIWKHVPDRTVTLLNLEDGVPAIAAQIKSGTQPTGVSITPDGRTAYVANRAEGTISVIDIDGNSLRERQRVKICEPGDSLAHVQLSPDGRQAVATLNEAHAVLHLAFTEDGLPKISQRIDHGKKPYAARFLPDGRTFAVADIGTDSVTIYRVNGGRPEILAEVTVGRVPEGLDVSPDGRWIAASCMEGANLTDKTNPKYGQPAKIFLIHLEANTWQVARILEVEGGPQFAFFSADGNCLVVSNTRLKTLAFYKTDGGAFTDTGFRLPVDGEPIAIAR